MRGDPLTLQLKDSLLIVPTQRVRISLSKWQVIGLGVCMCATDAHHARYTSCETWHQV